MIFLRRMLEAVRAKCEARIDRAEEVKAQLWKLELNGVKPKREEQWLLDTQGEHVFVCNVAGRVLDGL